MSEQWSDLGSGEPSETTANGTWDAAAVGTDTMEDSSDADPIDAVAEAPDIDAEVAADFAEAVVNQPEWSAVEAEDTSPEPETTFLSELARAMQATAASERLRMDTEIEQRRSAHVAEIRARQASEADRMRELAAEELTAIDAWAEGERERIRLERDRRAAALDEDLATSLADHTKQIDAEIEKVEVAVEAYRSEVDAFFADLDKETDVVVLAQRATARPAFPDLNFVVAATPGAGSAADADLPAGADDAAPHDVQQPIGVMDPTATGDGAASWASDAETVASADPATDVADEDVESALFDDDASEPVAAGAESGRKSLFQSVQVVHPTSWLRRNGAADDTRSD